MAADGVAATAIDARLVQHAHDLRFEDLPPDTVARAKLVILDTIGAALAAIEADGVRPLEQLMRRWAGTPEAGVFGYGTRGPRRTPSCMSRTSPM